MNLKILSLMTTIISMSVPVLAMTDMFSLKHDELAQKGIEFLVDEEVLAEKDAKCLVISLEKAMAESTFDNLLIGTLQKEDPSDIQSTPKSNYYLPTAKKGRIIF